MQIEVHKIAAVFADLLNRAVAGEEVVITRAGEPVAKLVPLLPRRRLGSAKGEFTVPEDFNDPLPNEIEDLFWK